MAKKQQVDLVWKVLSGMPIEVFDEENYSVWENEVWELVRPRPEGDFAGTRIIGSANMVTALNMLHQKMLIEYEFNNASNAMDTFKEILDELQQERLIRKKPQKIRETFKIV
jgi:hypothetical protein